MTYQWYQNCLKSSLLAVFLLLFQMIPAQDFSAFEQKVLAEQKVLGNDVVILVWKKDDTLVYKKELGSYNSKTQAPIASCSKWLTAALVMQFVDEGLISLDDPVSRWLPEFERYGKNYVTVRHCLSHMTGIDEETRLLKKLVQRSRYESLEEEVNQFARREIRSNPGNDFWYGNTGLNIAGRVLEVISRKKFDALIKQKLFNPLGMRKTSFTNPNGGAINPSGGAYSTADDYMRFLVMLLSGGQYGGKQILSPESVNELMKIHSSQDKVKYTPKSATGYNYALGSWVIEEQNGKATTLASPGLFGTWPMIDFCRGYAYLVFVKNLLGDERAGIHIELKEILDKQFPAQCP